METIKSYYNKMYIMFTENDIGSRYHFYLPIKKKAKVFRTSKLKLKLQMELPITSVSDETHPGSNSISFMPLQCSFP